MKRSIISVIAAVAVFALSACGDSGMHNVSERRSEYMTASGDGYTLTAVSGVREDPFLSDGSVADIKAYTLITLVPEKFDPDALYSYRAVTATQSYGGGFVLHPFAASYSAEFDAECAGALTVTVIHGDSESVFELTSCIPDGAITFSQAIEAARTELRPDGEYEIRARLIKNPLGGDGVCWHVEMCFADGSRSGVLLDPVTVKVLAKK